MDTNSSQPLRALLVEKLADSLVMPFPVATLRHVHGTGGLPGKATAVVGMRRAGKTTLVNPRKAYPVDPGLIPVFDRSRRSNHGHILETAVQVELERRGLQVSCVRTQQGYEVDFLARHPMGEAALIQVCADLDDPTTRQREVRALLAAADEHLHASLQLITLTPETAHDVPGQVTVYPAAQWFLAPAAWGT